MTKAESQRQIHPGIKELLIVLPAWPLIVGTVRSLKTGWFFCDTWCFRNPAREPVAVGSLPHYLQGIMTIPGGGLGFLSHQHYVDVHQDVYKNPKQQKNLLNTCRYMYMPQSPEICKRSLIYIDVYTHVLSQKYVALIQVDSCSICIPVLPCERNVYV